MVTEKITDLKLLESAAGYYIGRQYYDNEMKGWFPYSRDSEYFMTEEEAEVCLQYLRQPTRYTNNKHKQTNYANKNTNRSIHNNNDTCVYSSHTIHSNETQSCDVSFEYEGC